METWKHCDLQEDIQPKETEAGFQKLIEALQKLESQYKDAGRPIAAAHASHFAELVQELIKKLNNVAAAPSDANN